MRRKPYCMWGASSFVFVLLWSIAILVSAANDPVMIGAGDISECDSNGAAATAHLLEGIDGTIFTLGDHVYRDGTTEQFRSCYAPTWGRYKARTRPVPGNHDYHTDNGAPYYAYFGESAGEPGKGYYSYDRGAWHLVALNSNIAAETGSPQERWLRDDLAAHKTSCTLAYWHVPVFSSGRHGDDAHMKDLWRVLYAFGADVVVNGHDHNYERFAPQDPDGKADATRGIREFIVGTGGARLRPIKGQQANSEVRDGATWGVLKLTLRPTSYDWEFLPVAGGTFRDAGSTACVP